jgi:hypothetical protein
MYAELTPAEISLWEADYRNNPWGPERGDMQSGLVANAIWRSRGGTGQELDSYVMRFVPAGEAREERRQAARAALDAAVMGFGQQKKK